MVEVRWEDIPNVPINFTKWNISRSGAEQGPYTRIQQINRFDVLGNTVLQFVDPNGDPNQFYIITAFDPLTLQETDFTIGYFPLTPREFRLTRYIKSWVPDVLVQELKDLDYSLAIRFALNSFNVHPPETNFNITNFPKNYEQFIIVGAQVNIAYLKYLKLSILDFSYNDMGFALNIDRGTKISKAAEDIGRIYKETIAQGKWNFTSQGIGLGSLLLPLQSSGTTLRGSLNILDIMTNLSR